MAMVYSCVGCGSFSLQRIGEMIPTKGNNCKYSPATPISWQYFDLKDMAPYFE
jgi:hypothetical protein